MDPLKRMFFVGLAVPAIITTAVALLVWPNSPIEWLVVGVTPFVTSTAVALYYMARSRDTRRA